MSRSRVLVDLEAYWQSVLSQDTRQIWRWRFDAASRTPARWSALKTKHDKICASEDKWTLNNNGVDYEIILDTHVPQHVLAGWVSWRAAPGNRNENAWITWQLSITVGFNRGQLREMIAIIKNSKREERALQLSTNASNFTNTLGTQVAGRERYPSVVGAEHSQQTNSQINSNETRRYRPLNLRVEASWNSQPRLHPGFENAKQRADVELAVALLKAGKRIIMLTGAGTSIAAGIKAFRTPDGYHKDAESAFHYSTLTTPLGRKKHFETVGKIAQAARDLQDYPPWSHLEAYLSEKRGSPLHRLYTQNIDGLQDKWAALRSEGPPFSNYPKEMPTTVYIHGNIKWTYHQNCGRFGQLDPEACIKGDVIECLHCYKKVGLKRKRHIQEALPHVVLYNGIQHPKQWAKDEIIRQDRGLGIKGGKLASPVIADSLFIVGTGANLPEVKFMILDFAAVIRPRGGKVIWINLLRPPIIVEKVCDEIILVDCQLVGHHFFEDIDFSDIVGK